MEIIMRILGEEFCCCFVNPLEMRKTYVEKYTSYPLKKDHATFAALYRNLFVQQV